MSKNVEVSVRGPTIGLTTLLTVLFVGLKLTDHIDWSWVWVLGPLWIPLAGFIGVAAVIFLVGLLFAGIAAVWERVRG